MDLGSYTSTAVIALVAIAVGVGGAAALFWLGNAAAERLPTEWETRVKPWVFISPAIFVVGIFLIYPLFATVLASMKSDDLRQLNAGDTIPLQIDDTGALIGTVVGLFAAAAVVGFIRNRASQKVPAASESADDAPGGGTALQTTHSDEEPGPSSWVLAVVGLVVFAVVAALVYLLLDAVLPGPGLGDRVREFVGLDNYGMVLTDSATQSALFNNLLWVIFVPTFAVLIGLFVAVLADRLTTFWESVAKALIFLPMAISFIGASAIFTLVYNWQPEGQEQTGLLNAIVVALGGSPVEWLRNEAINDFALMAIMVWLQAGFAMVLLSAAIKNVPEDTIEAARIDGATELQIFFRVVVPQIFSTIVVVATTILILVLKIFDIVRALTQGRNNTDVVANEFYDKFALGQYGSAGVLVVVLVVLTIPFMVLNIKRFREQEAQR